MKIIKIVIGISFIVGVFVLPFLIDAFFDKFPRIANVLGVIVVTGGIWLMGYISALLIIHSYDQKVKSYRLNRPPENGTRDQWNQIEADEKPCAKIAGRITYKVGFIFVVAFWIIYWLRNRS
ncbi:MAG TPA: hypothetical protein VE344_08465 [Methylomirabilota bacterium]|nr:hypothetical protein [Methylomirabilota bacterium]